MLGTHEVIHDGVHWKLTNRHQTLTAKGPTESNYQVMVFVKDAHQNVEVNVEYYISVRDPKKQSKLFPPETTSVIYRWGWAPWKCVVGRGSAMGTCKRTRKVKCIDPERNKVSDHYCDSNKKPSTEEFGCTKDCPRRNVYG